VIATKRLTIGLPDDVAAYLAGVEDASATVAAAVRDHMQRTARWRQRLRPMNLDQRLRILRRRRQILDAAAEAGGQATRA
jgi:hypothetical protein